MTRKDYENFANTIRNLPDVIPKSELIIVLSGLLARDNAKFSCSTFYSACTKPLQAPDTAKGE